MRFSFIASALAFVAGAIAQTSVGPNAFNIATDGTQVYKAGTQYQLTWSNLQGSTVTIQLRTGDRGDLHDVGQPIVSNLKNTGSYTWTPDTSLPTGADYALEIIDDDDQTMINYSGQFVIQSNVEAVATNSASTTLLTLTTGSSASAAASSTAAASTTGSASAATTTGSATVTSSASATGSATGSATSSHASHTSSSASASVSASVPNTNAAVKPAAGALLMVAAGFAIAL